MTSRALLGARVIFSGGAVRLAPAMPTPHGWLPPRVSVVSPGTELRRLKATVAGPDYPAGYMTLTQPGPSGDALLAPVPHGAPVCPNDLRALSVPAGICAEHVAVARFQLIAALGLARWAEALRSAAEVVVIGSGPVAVGCVLELSRLGLPRVRLVTQHPEPAPAGLPTVTVSRSAPAASATAVIDCTGRAHAGLRAVAPGGLLGLLGTPALEDSLPAATIHRAGVTVVGMHELAGGDPQLYRRLFQVVLACVVTTITTATLRSWCRSYPGSQSPRVYTELAGTGRPLEPFLLLHWSP
jgi:hypothetical protein